MSNTAISYKKNFFGKFQNLLLNVRKETREGMRNACPFAHNILSTNLKIITHKETSLSSSSTR